MKNRLLLAVIVVLISALFSAPVLAAPGNTSAPSPTPAPTGTREPIDWNQAAPGGTLSPDKIMAGSAILIDAKTGKVLFDKDSGSKQYPASTTKIMTCLLALEHVDDLKKNVTVGALPDLGDPKAVSYGLKKGETIPMESLLYILMLPSANDAANAIAIAVAGSVDKFVAMMNARAKDLGMTGTQYRDTNGLADDAEHYTTAADMAKLATVAMGNQTFRSIVSAKSYPVPATNMHKAKTITNTNYLLDASKSMDFYEYANGIKTGYTSMAQNAFVASAQKDSVSLIAVSMNDKNREDIWSDNITLFEYGFKFFNTSNISSLVQGKTLSLPIKGAAASDPGKGSLDVTIKPRGDAYITDRAELLEKLKNDPLALEHKLAVTSDKAPIKQNDILGTITYSQDGTDVLTCDLVATRDVAMVTPKPTPSPVPATMSPAPTKPAVSATAEPASSGTTIVVLITVGGLLAVLLVIALLVWGLRAGKRRQSSQNQRSMRR